MTATASRSNASGDAVLAPVSGKIAESVLAVMKYVGIRKLECSRLRASEYERLTSKATLFKDTPPQIAACGILLKDALAAILAASGIVKLEIDATDDEAKQMAEGYARMCEAAKRTTDGSVKKDDAANAGKTV